MPSSLRSLTISFDKFHLRFFWGQAALACSYSIRLSFIPRWFGNVREYSLNRVSTLKYRVATGEFASWRGGDILRITATFKTHVPASRQHRKINRVRIVACQGEIPGIMRFL